MIQSPKQGSGSTNEILAGAIALVVWLLEGAALYAATFFAGGEPKLGFALMWPPRAFIAAITGKLSEPWLLVSPPDGAIPDPAFWTIFIAINVIVVIPGTILAAGFAYDFVRGGLTAFFPVRRDSHFATNYDLKKLKITKPQERRIALGSVGGGLIAAERGASALVFGPTQSGKTSGICIPAINEHQGPVLAISVKRDMVDNTIGWRQRQGKVFVFDPSQSTDLAFTTWSPLSGCEEFEYAIKVAAWMTQGMDKAKGGDSDWGHWADAANRLLSAALYAAASLGEPITSVRVWINDVSGYKLEVALKRVAELDERAWENYMSIKERPDRERASCYSTSQRMLRVFMEDKVAESTATSEFQPYEFLTTGDNTLYLIAPVTEQKRLTPLFTGLVMSVINEAAKIAQSSKTGSLSRGLLCVLDECANTAPIEELPEYLSTGFSQGIQLITIFQDRSQIVDRYGQNRADSICNNSRATLFLPGIKDPATLEYASKLVGKTEEWNYSYAKGGASRSLQSRELISADVLRQVKLGTALLVYHTYPPIILKIRFWFQNAELKRRGQIEYVPNVVHVEGGTDKGITEFNLPYPLNMLKEQAQSMFSAITNR